MTTTCTCTCIINVSIFTETGQGYKGINESLLKIKYIIEKKLNKFPGQQTTLNLLIKPLNR